MFWFVIQDGNLLLFYKILNSTYADKWETWNTERTENERSKIYKNIRRLKICQVICCAFQKVYVNKLNCQSRIIMNPWWIYRECFCWVLFNNLSCYSIQSLSLFLVYDTVAVEHRLLMGESVWIAEKSKRLIKTVSCEFSNQPDLFSRDFLRGSARCVSRPR